MYFNHKSFTKNNIFIKKEGINSESICCDNFNFNLMKKH